MIGTKDKVKEKCTRTERGVQRFRDTDTQIQSVSVRDGEREGWTQSEQGAATVKLLK